MAQTRKVPEKSTVVGWPSNPKPKPSDKHGPEEKDGEDSDRDPTGPTNSFLADNTTPEKGLGLIPRKVAVAHSFESEPQKKQKATASSPPKPKNSGPSEPTKALQSDNCVDAILDHVPRKRPAVGPSNGEPKKKQELPTKANQKNDTGNSKKGGRVRDLVTVAGENPLSPQARLKPGKKKKSTEGEQRKKKNLGKKNMGDPAGQSRPSSATIPMKRKISESKCHAYDDTELERKYLMIVESFKEVVEKFVYSKETLTEVMEEKKPTWEKKINAPGRVFNALWSKVESGLSKNVDFSGGDWSFLVVGKNFDLGKVDFSQWDSCEVIDDDSDGMSV